MSSSGAAFAAVCGRGNRLDEVEDSEYQVILPTLPTGRVVLNTVFLHGDVRVRPFRVEDFRDALTKTGTLPDVVALGAYQINHVWAVTLSSAEATKRLLAFKELKVKGRRCLILDPENQQVKLRLHWMLHGVTDEDIRTALAAFGKVTEVTRERWRVQGVQEKGSTTRTVLLKMKPGMKVEDLPHQIRVAGELALVVAPGRPMQCLRCRGTGHVRRECKIPRCSKCRRFGHGDAECVRTYAAATGSASTEEVADHLMDVAEAEEAAKGAGQDKPAATPDSSALDGRGKDLSNEESKQPPTTHGEGTEGGGASDAEGRPEPDTSEPGSSQEPLVKSGARATSVTGAAKRTHAERGNEKDQATDASNEEPPTKTTQGRRLGLRPKPTVPTDARAAEKQALQQGRPPQTDGTGDNKSV